MNKQVAILLLIIVGFGVIIWAGLIQPPNPFYVPPVHAAPAIKQQQPGCTQFATVGQVTIYRCVDEAGNVFAANDVGMMTSLGN